MLNSKYVLIMVFALLFQRSLNGQDVITKKDGSRILATVTDTSGRNIHYTYKGTNIYKMPKRDVQKIQYANGRVSTLSGPEKAQEERTGRRFLVGPTVGVGFNTGRYDYKTTPPPALSIGLAPVAGITFDWRMARHFATHIHFMYKGKGDRIDMNQWIQKINENDPEPSLGSVVAKGYTTTTINYAEASLLPVIVLGKHLEVGAGGFFAYGLSGKRVADYTVTYDYDLFPLGETIYNEEHPVEFISIAPSSIEEGKLYINRWDYGLAGHLGLRLNPVKISLGLSYSTKQWEPDSKLSTLFFDDINHTYHLATNLTVSWFFGAK